MEVKTRNGPVAYIASAYSGDIEGNTEKTKAYSLFVINKGAVPINPILNLTGVLDERTERNTALGIDLAILSKADEIWIFGVPTDGMLIEIEEAGRIGKKLRWFSEDMEEL